jgi:hypothetical protein
MAIVISIYLVKYIIFFGLSAVVDTASGVCGQACQVRSNCTNLDLWVLLGKPIDCILFCESGIGGFCQIDGHFLHQNTNWFGIKGHF